VRDRGSDLGIGRSQIEKLDEAIHCGGGIGERVVMFQPQHGPGAIRQGGIPGLDHRRDYRFARLGRPPALSPKR